MADDLTLGGTSIRVAAARAAIGVGTGIFLDLVSGYAEPATARGEDTIIPSIAGRVIRDRVKDYRRIVLEGYVIGTSASDWRSKTDALMALLSGTYASGSNLVIANAYLGTSSSKTIAVRCVNVMPGPIFAQLFQTWSIELESVAPDWS